ncbi:MAG: PIN domain-containing protein [Anaerolineae bacterium]|nr:PIN domain-containing protein [Anaerolineae bacterium]
MLNPILIDSSFLYELHNPKTFFRTQVAQFVQVEKRPRIVPDVVLTEGAYLIRQRIGQHAVIRFLTTVDILGFQFEPVTGSDLKRAGQIMNHYRDADFDFVDCCIMAISERLNITTVYTLDRRDFAMFRPTHCEYLELLP